MGDTSAAGWERPVAHVSVTLHKATTESLGLELGSGDLGQPVIHGIARDGVAAKDGQLRRGDELRTVNGAPCHTCAAAVSAIRAIGGAPTPLEIERPVRGTLEPRRVWTDSALELGAGSAFPISFHADRAQVLKFQFSVSPGRVNTARLDVVFKVGLVPQRDEARTPGAPSPGGASADADIFGGGMLVLERRAEHAGHVELPKSGRYTAIFDNSFSLLTQKRLSFKLTLISAEQHAASMRSHLEREVARRVARAEALASEAASLTSRVAELEATLLSTQAEERSNAAKLDFARGQLARLPTSAPRADQQQQESAPYETPRRSEQRVRASEARSIGPA